MSYIPIFKGVVTKGMLIFSNQDKFNDYLSSLDGKDVQIIVRKPTKIRSVNQNRYYWGVILDLLSRETGYEPEEIHEFLKNMFLFKHMSIIGEDVGYAKSTTDLTTVEMEEYLSKCREWGATFLNVSIPEPNEGRYENNNT